MLRHYDITSHKQTVTEADRFQRKFEEFARRWRPEIRKTVIAGEGYKVKITRLLIPRESPGHNRPSYAHISPRYGAPGEVHQNSIINNRLSRFPTSLRDMGHLAKLGKTTADPSTHHPQAELRLGPRSLRMTLLQARRHDCLFRNMGGRHAAEFIRV